MKKIYVGIIFFVIVSLILISMELFQPSYFQGILSWQNNSISNKSNLERERDDLVYTYISEIPSLDLNHKKNVQAGDLLSFYERTKDEFSSIENYRLLRVMTKKETIGRDVNLSGIEEWFISLISVAVPAYEELECHKYRSKIIDTGSGSEEEFVKETEELTKDDLIEENSKEVRKHIICGEIYNDIEKIVETSIKSVKNEEIYRGKASLQPVLRLDSIRHELKEGENFTNVNKDLVLKTHLHLLLSYEKLKNNWEVISEEYSNTEHMDINEGIEWLRKEIKKLTPEETNIDRLKQKI